MSSVVIGAEYGAKTLARALMDGSEKTPLCSAAVPVIFNTDIRRPSARTKGSNINRIGMGMLGEAAGTGYIAAAIAAHGFDPLQLAAQMYPAARLTANSVQAANLGSELTLDRVPRLVTGMPRPASSSLILSIWLHPPLKLRLGSGEKRTLAFCKAP